MKILFINANLYGHINPTLAFVRELTKNGHTVRYFCDQPFAASVTEAGAEWIGYNESLIKLLKEYRPTDRHPFFMLMEYMLLYQEAVLPQILRIVEEENYDFLLCDSIFGGGIFLKEIVNIPVVISHSSFAMSHAPVPTRMLEPGFHPQLDHCYVIRQRICSKYGIKEPSIEALFVCRGERNIVYTTEQFNSNPLITTPDYLFTGPAINREEEVSDAIISEDKDTFTIEDTSEYRGIIYISLGSVNTDFAEFYRVCITALADCEYRVYMSIGRKVNKDELGLIPENFIIKSFLPQLQILEKADLFLTHAGFNSVNEALYYGVPMIAFPLVNDQHMVAKHIAELSLGCVENMKEITPDILRSRIMSLLSDSVIRENCRLMSQDMKAQSGLSLVVETLIHYIEERKRHGTQK